MRLLKAFVLLPVILVFFLSCAPQPTVQAADAAATSKGRALEEEILLYVNRHRRTLGLAPLETLPVATEQAYRHSRNMAVGKTAFSHDGFDERVQQIRKSMGFISASAENVAYGQLSAKEVVEGWLHSPGHRRNIEGDYRYTGIGYYRNRNGVLYFTQLFLRK